MRCLHYSIIGSCHNGMEAVPERLSVYTRMQISEAATGGVLRNFAKLTRKHLCQSLSKAWPATLLKKETLAQVFFCEFYEISKNNCFKEPPPGRLLLKFASSFSYPESNHKTTI